MASLIEQYQDPSHNSHPILHPTMDPLTTESWCRSIPSVCLPTPPKLEPARLAYRRSRTVGTMSDDNLETLQADEPSHHLRRKRRSTLDRLSGGRWSRREVSPMALPLLPTASASESELPEVPQRSYSRDGSATARPAPAIRQRVMRSTRPFSAPGSNGYPESLGRAAFEHFEDIPLEDLDSAGELHPRRPPKLRRSCFSRPPGETPWPHRRDGPNSSNLTKAAQPLPRTPTPPPVPPRDTLAPPPPPPLEPLNGVTARLHAYTALFAVANTWGYANTYGLFQAHYTTALLSHLSPSKIAWIGSTQLFLLFGLGVPVGIAVDAGWFKTVFRTSALLLVIGIFATSACTSFGTLWLCQGFITGVGMGGVFGAGVLALLGWFDARRVGGAMALGAAGSCLGGIAYICLVRNLLPKLGFGTTMRVLGAVVAGTMVPAVLVFRVRVPAPQRWGGDRPHTRARSWSRLREQRGGKKGQVVPLLPYGLTALGLSLTFLGLYFTTTYLPLYTTTTLRLPPTPSSNLLIALLAASLPGRLLPGFLSDACLGPLNTMIPSAFLSAAVVGLWIAVAGSEKPGYGMLMVVAAFYGFVSAGVQTLYAPAVQAVCLPTPSAQRSRRHLHPESGREPDDEPAEAPTPQNTGLKAGLVFTLIGVACLIGTPIGGALISHRVDRGLPHPYLGAQVFAAVCLGVGGCVLVAARVARAGCGAGRA